MSSPTWTPPALASSARRYAGEVWRCVEAQHKFSTMRLVDTSQEQEILEAELELSKPLMPSVEHRKLDFLLLTPFRYPPPRGSRFRRPNQRQGAFYAGESVETTLWEIAFYKYLFWADALDAVTPSSPVEHSVFSVRVDASAALDLLAPPLSAYSEQWTRLSDYGPCQMLADAARELSIQLIRYQSVRDPDRGASVALLTPDAFKSSKPIKLQTWRILMKTDRIIAFCENPRLQREFPLAAFIADERLQPLLR